MSKKIVDFLIVFSLLFAIGIFLVVLLGSLNYWVGSIPHNTSLSEMLYHVGILIAILSGIMLFVQQYIQVLGETLESLLSKKSKGRKN